MTLILRISVLLAVIIAVYFYAKSDILSAIYFLGIAIFGKLLFVQDLIENRKEGR